MDNFRTPNFPLVADIMFWLVLRYDPAAKLPDDIDTEGQRVAFLTAVGQVRILARGHPTNRAQPA